MLVRIPTDATSLVDIAPAFAIVGVGVGVGVGVAQIALQIAAFAGSDKDEAGLAGSAIETSHEMGGALGLAVLASVALAGTTNVTEVFHRSILGAAIARRSERNRRNHTAAADRRPL